MPGSEPTLNPAPTTSQTRILIFRIGQLGDTIASIPAIRAIRERYPEAHIALLCDFHPARPELVLAADLLKPTGLIDSFEQYPVDNTWQGRLSQPWRMLRLALRLRRKSFDTLAYLAPSTRTKRQVQRDARFFAAAGIRNFLGMRYFPPLPIKTPGVPLAAVHGEPSLLLQRLAADGIPVPCKGSASLDLKLGKTEREEFIAWRSQLPSDGARRWIGVGPGTKQPVNAWPIDRYASVVSQLVEKFDFWPVVFGGPEDRPSGDYLTRSWNRGYNAAGALSVRSACMALRECILYVGNDTGTMHLAAAASIPCVGVYSSREWPGMWYPYGVPRRVIRSPIECEGCRLTICQLRQNECINRIQPRTVFQACLELLICQHQSSNCTK